MGVGRVEKKGGETECKLVRVHFAVCSLDQRCLPGEGAGREAEDCRE